MSHGKTTVRQAATTVRTSAEAAKRKPAPRQNQTEAARKSGNGKRRVSAEERFKMIQFSAYQRAESRGFEGGSPEQDWLEAEAEIDQMLATTSH